MSNSPTLPSQLPGSFSPVSDFCLVASPGADTALDLTRCIFEVPTHDYSLSNILVPPPETATTIAISSYHASSAQSGSSTASDMQTVPPAAYFRIKSGVDRCLAAGLIVVALPAFLIVGLTALAVQGRPVFYRQARVGRAGRIFRIWKFRTMRNDAESNSGAVWSIVGDPRVTRLGSLLRASHLDELPQLINVLKGEMDLVGPRPERPEFVRELSAEFPHYPQRLVVKPGISGLAQLRLGYDVSIADVDKKLQLDLEYIRTASLRKDFGLLLQTIPYIMRKMWSGWLTSSARHRSNQASPCQNFVATEMVAAKQIRRSRLDMAGAVYPKANHLTGVATAASATALDHN